MTGSTKHSSPRDQMPSNPSEPQATSPTSSTLRSPTGAPVGWKKKFLEEFRKLDPNNMPDTP
ncbi:MAG: hypothetical protein QM769_12090 [Pseudoxanthomonas sp.]